MLKAHRNKLPIVLAAAFALALTLAWSTSEARPYAGFGPSVSGQLKQAAGVLSGEPDTPGITPPNGGNGTRSVGRTGGSDHQRVKWTRGMWVTLLWMRTILR